MKRTQPTATPLMSDRPTSSSRRLHGLTASALVVALLLLAVPASASIDGIFVYTDDTRPGASDLTEFGAAADRPLETSASWPSDLSKYACVILPTNQSPFDETMKAALGSYIDAGGTVVALTEFAGFAPRSITAMNDLAGSLDSNLSLEAAFIDPGWHVTEDIEDTPWTQGVSRLQYAAGSRLIAAAPAQVLVSYASGPAMLGVERLGDGLFVLSGDSSLFITVPPTQGFTGYSEYDNGVLASNLCGKRTADVAGRLAGIVDAIQDMDLNPGIERSLIAKLDEAAASWEAEDLVQSCTALRALVSQVAALGGGRHLPAAHADTIRADVDAVRAELDC